MRSRLLGPLGVRLAAAFLAVAVAAVAVLAALTIFASGAQVHGLVTSEHRSDTQAAAAALAQAYAMSGGWVRADLTPATAIAAKDQGSLLVTDADGVVVAAPTDAMAQMMVAMHGVSSMTVPLGTPLTSPVVVSGETVGYAQLRFPASGLPAPERELRHALWRTAVAGTIVAALVALLVALFVASRVTRPVVALTAAAERLASGDRAVRSGHADAPGELGVLAASFDRMANSLQREDALRRSLIADVTHELRTPLTILRGQTEALLDGVSEVSPQTLESLHDEVVRTGRVVGDLETLAAAEAATFGLRMFPIELAEIASDTVDLVRPAAEEAGLRLEVNGEGARCSGDPGRLHQVTLNLLTNAVKFTPRGGLIVVRTWTDSAGAHLAVTDTGAGIPDDELVHVSERFWRGQNARATPGSGIGLAIAAELAGAHHGELRATNATRGGAVFTLTLPST